MLRGVQREGDEPQQDTEGGDQEKAQAYLRHYTGRVPALDLGHGTDNTADKKAPEWAMPKNSSLYG